MEDLLEELTIDILLRLPVKTIIHCKLVCNKWRNLVSDPLFVNLHLSRSPTGFIFLRNAGFLVPPETVDLYRDERILEWVEIDIDRCLIYETILDLNMVPDFNCARICEIGSVNGLIFLRMDTPYRDDDDTSIVCNPVTREIIIIPSPSPSPSPKCKYSTIITAYGFGVGSLTGEYKVVRTLINDNNGTRAEVYTLGTGQWRSLGRIPYKFYPFDHVAVLNDHCHWMIVVSDNAPEKICTFDLNKETFQLFPSPPPPPPSAYHFTSLAVLNGCLCKCDAYFSQITIWVMKEYGIKESWHKEAVIKADPCFRPSWAKRSPIEGFKDGTTLFVSRRGGRSRRAFYPRGTDRFEDLETFDRLEGGLAYRPSFLKLQDFESEKVLTF